MTQLHRSADVARRYYEKIVSKTTMSGSDKCINVSADSAIEVPHAHYTNEGTTFHCCKRNGETHIAVAG